MDADSSTVVVLCTVPDKRTANTIASALVSQKLDACVNIIDAINSVYQWDGEVVTDTECQLVIKTALSHVDDAYNNVCQNHPYDVPEWVVLKADASEPYFTWIKSSLK